MAIIFLKSGQFLLADESVESLTKRLDGLGKDGLFLFTKDRAGNRGVVVITEIAAIVDKPNDETPKGTTDGNCRPLQDHREIS